MLMGREVLRNTECISIKLMRLSYEISYEICLGNLHSALGSDKSSDLHFVRLSYEILLSMNAVGTDAYKTARCYIEDHTGHPHTHVEHLSKSNNSNTCTSNNSNNSKYVNTSNTVIIVIPVL